MDSGASFVVVLHQVWKKHPLHRDFLGLYTLGSDKLSEQTHGLLGMASFNVFTLVFPYESTSFVDTILYLVLLNRDNGGDWDDLDWLH